MRPRSGLRLFGGFDPGHSQKNPAAFVLLAVDDRIGMPRAVAAQCAAEWPIQKWVPFFKRWHPNALTRMRIRYGGPDEQDRLFSSYGYTDDDLALMEKLSWYGHHSVSWHGDKYGLNRESGTDSAYEILRMYGIDVQTHYRHERADEVRKAQDVWVPSLLVEEDVAEYRALRPDGGRYHSLSQCVQMAAMVSTEGVSDPKYDISAKLPDRYVKHYIDALIYSFRELEDFVHFRSGPEGAVSVEGGYGESRIVHYVGDDGL